MRFVTLLMCLVVLLGCAKEEAAAVKEKPVVRVVCATVARRDFVYKVNLLSTLKASDYAITCARATGNLDEVWVVKGTPTVKGETKLFQIDKENAERSVIVADQDLNVAKSSLDVAKATLEQVKADFHVDELNYERYKVLLEKAVVPIEQYQDYEASYLKSKANVAVAEANIKLSEDKVKQAEAALGIAKKNLEDTVSLAPYTGYVVWCNYLAGDFVGVGSQVCMVADTYHLEMWAAVPAVYYSLIKAKETQFTVYYKGEKVGTYPIAMKAPTIDEKLRTFDIKGYLNNEDGNLVPGTLTQVEIELQSKNGLAVPLASVLHRRDNDVVYVLDSDGKTVKEVAVVKGPDTEGMIEVSSPDLKEGMQVLVEGQSQISDGDVVEVMSK